VGAPVTKTLGAARRPRATVAAGFVRWFATGVVLICYAAAELGCGGGDSLFSFSGAARFDRPYSQLAASATIVSLLQILCRCT
jgi:hypothetical protein